MKIFYIFFVDISKTNGPIIIERGLIPLLYELIGNDDHLLIPEP